MLSSVASHESLDDARQGTRARRALAGLRIYVGLIFLLAVVPKLSGDFAPRLSGFLSHVGLAEGHPFYRAFLSPPSYPTSRSSPGWSGPASS
jgi:hypothetical protein